MAGEVVIADGKTISPLYEPELSLQLQYLVEGDADEPAFDLALEAVGLFALERGGVHGESEHVLSPVLGAPEYLLKVSFCSRLLLVVGRVEVEFLRGDACGEGEVEEHLVLLLFHSAALRVLVEGVEVLGRHLQHTALGTLHSF